jgi:hypothetical protein
LTTSSTPPKPRPPKRPRAVARAGPAKHIAHFRPDSAQDIADEELSAYLWRLKNGLETFPGDPKPPPSPQKPSRPKRPHAVKGRSAVLEALFGPGNRTRAAQS